MCGINAGFTISLRVLVSRPPHVGQNELQREALMYRVALFCLVFRGFSLDFAWPWSSIRWTVTGVFMLISDWHALLRLTREKRGSAFDFRPESFLVTIAYSTLNLVFESGVMSNDGAQLLR